MEITRRSCIRLGLSLFAVYIGVVYWPVAQAAASALLCAARPLMIGGVIAYVINILMSFYERHVLEHAQRGLVRKLRRPLCLLAAFATLVIVLTALVYLVVPQLAASVELLTAQIPGAIASGLAWLESMHIVPQDLLSPLAAIDWKARMEQIIGAVTAGVGNVMGTAVNLVSSAFSGVVTAVFALIFSIYLLMGKERLSRQLRSAAKRYIRLRAYCRICHVLCVTNECFHRYIVGQCTEAVILGVLCALGMMLLKLPYAAMTGAVIAFTALIPVAGGYIGAGLGAFMIFTVSPVKALVFLIYIVILQQLEGNLIYPRVVGSSMGLPAIWVLAAVAVVGGVWGVLGMLVGVPITASIYRLLRESVYAQQETKAASTK